MDPKQKEAENIIKSLLEILEISSELKIASSQDRMAISLSGENLGALIGFRGETLNSIQLFLEIALFKKFGEWVPVTLDIGEYRKEREGQLRVLAIKYCDKAQFFARPIELPPMSSYDRMVVHTVVAEFPALRSESFGEGRLRHIVISPEEKENAI